MSRLYYTHKVIQCLDLLNLIGTYKHEFERSVDIEKLNATELFQNIVFLVFYCHCSGCHGVTARNADTGGRLQIKSCKCDTGFIMVFFSCFEKYKRIPYYQDICLLDKKNIPIHNQRILSEYVLDSDILFDFFQ